MGNSSVAATREALDMPRADDWCGEDLRGLSRLRRRRLARKFMQEVVDPVLNDIEEDWAIDELAKYPHDPSLTAHALAQHKISPQALRAWGFLRLRGYLPDFVKQSNRCFLCGELCPDLMEHLTTCCTMLSVAQEHM